MKAWQLTMTNEPLVLNEVPEPTPGPGEVVLDIKAAGLCHSDVGAMTDPGWLAIIPNRPITIGHEIAGVVSALGEGVTDVKIGDRVGVCPTASELAPGYGRDGGFTYKHRVLAGDLVPMPDALSFELAALGTDAGMTAYQAMVVRGGLKPGMKVGVIGLGGLGQIGARVAVVKGAEVHVAEMNKAVWPLAKELGVTSVVADVSEWAGQGFDLILNKAQLLGSVGGTKEDVAAVYELIGSGDLKPVVTVITFDEIPDSLEKLHQGKVVGRLVAHIAD
ncbi:MAG TPA: alcohol dehydrogenase catalytic domain-containing protein [Cellulomonas sp.]